MYASIVNIKICVNLGQEIHPLRKANIIIEKYRNESNESLISRFRKAVDVDGVLKDYKLNFIISRKERENFKKFAALRRSKKKEKRIISAKTFK